MANARNRPPKNRDVKPASGAAIPSSKKPEGRPTKYLKIYADMARKFFLLNMGGKDSELAEFLDVAESTVHLWKQEHAEFSESIKDGKLRANAEVAASLYQRAVGFEVKVQKMDKQGEIVDLKEFIPGEVNAQRLFLMNRAGWRDKTSLEHSGADGGPIELAELTVGDLKKLAKERGLLGKP